MVGSENSYFKGKKNFTSTSHQLMETSNNTLFTFFDPILIFSLEKAGGCLTGLLIVCCSFKQSSLNVLLECVYTRRMSSKGWSSK